MTLVLKHGCKIHAGHKLLQFGGERDLTILMRFASGEKVVQVGRLIKSRVAGTLYFGKMCGWEIQL